MGIGLKEHEIERLQKLCRSIGDTTSAAFRALGEAMRAAIPAWLRFIDSVATCEASYQIAEREYAWRFGRPPGSNRTARLRKKRRKAVVDWWLANYEREC